MYIRRQVYTAALIGAAVFLWSTGVNLYGDVRADCPDGPTHNGVLCATDSVLLVVDGLLIVGAVAGAFYFAPELAADATFAAAAGGVGDSVGLLTGEAAASNAAAAIDAGVQLAESAGAATAPDAAVEAAVAGSGSTIDSVAASGQAAADQAASNPPIHRARSKDAASAPAVFLLDGKPAQPSHNYGLNRTRHNPAHVEWQWSANHPIQKYTTFTHNNNLQFFHHRNITDGSVGLAKSTSRNRSTKRQYATGYIDVTLEMSVAVDTVGKLSPQEAFQSNIPALAQDLMGYLEANKAGGDCFQMLVGVSTQLTTSHEIIFGLALQAGEKNPTMGYLVGCQGATFDHIVDWGA